MEQILFSSIDVVDENVVVLSIEDAKSNKTCKTKTTVNHPAVVECIKSIAGSPCEEMDYGLYGTMEDLTTGRRLHSILKGIVKQASEQTPGTLEHNKYLDWKRKEDEKWKKECAAKRKKNRELKLKNSESIKKA